MFHRFHHQLSRFLQGIRRHLEHQFVVHLRRQGLPAQLLLQVHDELVLEVAPDALDATRELVVQTMEQAVALSVPLVVETGVGANWMEAK